MMQDDLARFPLLQPRLRGRVLHHEVVLPGTALQNDRWTVTSITGAEPGPVIFITAGIHGAEYPPIQTAIELTRALDPADLRGTLVVMPVVNVPAFWQRSMFVCPVDGKNLNRVFPGRPDGSYSEQLAHAVMTEFIEQADVHIDLHCGDLVEALIPFSICQRVDSDAGRQARELAEVFGLPFLLEVDRPVQPSGTRSYAAATVRGVPSFIAEAGGIGQLDATSVSLLLEGTLRVLAHLEMIGDGPEPAPATTVLSSFEWLYSSEAGLFYSSVGVGDEVQAGQVVGRIGSLTGAHLAEIRSPVTGTVLFLTTSPAMPRDGLLMGIGVA